MAVKPTTSPKKQKTFWNLSKGKILKRILGPFRENGMWSMGCIEEFVENMRILTEYRALNSRDCSGLDTYRRPFQPYTKKALKADFIGNRPGVRPRFKWEECVQGDAARLLVCSHEVLNDFVMCTF
jgi:hypothetical protein